MVEEISTAIIPRPALIEALAGKVHLNHSTRVVADEALRAQADELGQVIAALPAGANDAKNGALTHVTIELAIDKASTDREAYVLQIDAGKIRITGDAPGVFYGVQSLLQLIGAAERGAQGIVLAAMRIVDQPRFKWRGLMMDVSRHFFTADQVCRMLDLMSLYKLNRFHWHLTDDQGWRFPVKRYPLLTEAGGWRRQTLIGRDGERPRRYDGKPYGGAYTIEDIRRVVAHAAARHITIVPEIDMPGHMQAAICAYPWLGNTSARIETRCHWGISQHILNPLPATIEFMQNVLEEVCDVFPGDFVHIGGDEAVKHEWHESLVAQNRMRELGLKNEAEMQSWYIKQMDVVLKRRGKRLIGWDEILEGGLSEGAAVMGWRGFTHAVKAAQAGHDVVMAPTSPTYFDFYQAEAATQPLAIGGMNTLDRVYSFEPIAPELGADKQHHVLGGQCQLWAEHMVSFDHLRYMAFPRACALAEVLWSPREGRDYNEFVARLNRNRMNLETRKVPHGPIPQATAR